MKKELVGNAAAEASIDRAAAWVQEHYPRDLRRFLEDAVHFQKTGERRATPRQQQEKHQKTHSAGS